MFDDGTTPAVRSKIAMALLVTPFKGFDWSLVNIFSSDVILNGIIMLKRGGSSRSNDLVGLTERERKKKKKGKKK